MGFNYFGTAGFGGKSVLKKWDDDISTIELVMRIWRVWQWYVNILVHVC